MTWHCGLAANGSSRHPELSENSIATMDSHNCRRIITMKPKSPISPSSREAGSQAEAKDDLKSLPMPEVEKKLESSPDGLSQAEAQEAAGAIWAQRDRRKENQSVPEIPHLFLGPHPVDDRSGRDPFGRSPALAGLFHHPPFACVQRRGRILGRTPGGQRHRGAEGQAGGQGQR